MRSLGLLGVFWINSSKKLLDLAVRQTFEPGKPSALTGEGNTEFSAVLAAGCILPLDGQDCRDASRPSTSAVGDAQAECAVRAAWEVDPESRRENRCRRVQHGDRYVERLSTAAVQQCPLDVLSPQHNETSRRDFGQRFTCLPSEEESDSVSLEIGDYRDEYREQDTDPRRDITPVQVRNPFHARTLSRRGRRREAPRGGAALIRQSTEVRAQSGVVGSGRRKRRAIQFHAANIAAAKPWCCGSGRGRSAVIARAACSAGILPVVASSQYKAAGTTKSRLLRTPRWMSRSVFRTLVLICSIRSTAARSGRRSAASARRFSIPVSHQLRARSSFRRARDIRPRLVTSGAANSGAGFPAAVKDALRNAAYERITSSNATLRRSTKAAWRATDRSTTKSRTATSAAIAAPTTAAPISSPMSRTLSAATS